MLARAPGQLPAHSGELPPPGTSPAFSLGAPSLLVGECSLWMALETEAPGPTMALPQIPLPGY